MTTSLDFFHMTPTEESDPQSTFAKFELRLSHVSQFPECLMEKKRLNLNR